MPIVRLSRNIELKRDQVLVLIKKDFKLKYDSTALGMLWSIVTPLLMSLVYYFVIYNSTILYMFEAIMSAPKNILSRMTYRLVVDLKPDVDVGKLRAGYQNLLLADGTGLDSHAGLNARGFCRGLLSFLKHAYGRIV